MLDDKDTFSPEQSEIDRMRWFLGASLRLSPKEKACRSIASELMGRSGDDQLMNGIDEELREMGLLPLLMKGETNGWKPGIPAQ
jgi:hypothetical protein